MGEAERALEPRDCEVVTLRVIGKEFNEGARHQWNSKEVSARLTESSVQCHGPEEFPGFQELACLCIPTSSVMGRGQSLEHGHSLEIQSGSNYHVDHTSFLV